MITLADGEKVVTETAGGGGYGPPSERDPERVIIDVREGWISAARARDVYRVVVNDIGEADVGASAALRST